MAQREEELIGEINTTLKNQQLLLMQKSRMHWLADGNRNTDFFHRMHKISKSKSNLSSLMIDGQLCEDRQRIATHIQDFYKNLFNDCRSSNSHLDFVKEIIQPMVTHEQNVALVRVPSAVEIKNTVFEMSSVSAPGPDGFGGVFFQSAWDIVQHDIINAVGYFFSNAFIPMGLNSNIVTLIPKCQGASRIEDFRPIVLGNFIYKVFTKIIVARLGPLLRISLSSSQYGFIPGKKIHHCIVAGSEGFHCLRKGGGNIAMKIDIRKAFDTMHWDFLLYVLSCMGFEEHFCKLIRTILHSARLSVSINGSLEGYFGCTRGVRQGDPLSPLLFSIGEEVLARMIDYNDGFRKIMKAEAKMGVLVPTNLLYADDILIFCKATRDNVLLLRDIFRQYGEASGQIINLEKSQIFYGQQLTTGFKHFVFHTLGFTEGSLPINYLGVPIFIGKPKITHLQQTADRIIRKFDRWSGALLSLAGRVCLINSVIASSLTHSMMVYRWPRALLKTIDVAMRNFLWNGDISK